MRYLQGAALAAGILGSAAAFGQTPSGPATAPMPAQPAASAAANGRLGGGDQEFVNKAAVGGLFEVAAGRVAEKRASTAQVRSFAARMVRDHGAANSKLKRIAAADGGTIPSALDQRHQQQLQQLASQPGASFDRDYMRTMVADHDADVQEFDQAAKGLADPKLKTFARQTLKVIDRHDRIAHRITDKMASK